MFAVLTMITTQIGVQILLMTALLLSRSSPQWLLTRMPGRRRDPTGKNALELTVEMVHVAMMQVILSVVRFVMMDPYGVLILLMTALLLSRSSPQWLPKKRFRSPQNNWLMDVMVQIVEITGVAMKVTTLSAAPLVVMESNGVLMMLMTVLLPE